MTYYLVTRFENTMAQPLYLTSLSCVTIFRIKEKINKYVNTLMQTMIFCTFLLRIHLIYNVAIKGDPY